MKRLVNELTSYIREATAAQQAKQAGYKHLGGGYWAQGNSTTADATTRGNVFRKLTPKEKAAYAKKGPAEEPETEPIGQPVEEPEADPVDTFRQEAASDPKLDKLFSYKDRKSSRVSRMMALNAFKTTIAERLRGDQKKRAKKLLSGIEAMLQTHASGNTELASDLAKELHKEFKFYSNTSGGTFKTLEFGMGERHIFGKTVLAKDLVEIFKIAGIDTTIVDDQDKGFKKALSGTSKPDLGDEFDFKKSERTRNILSKFSQVPDEYKKLFGPKGQDGDLLDNTGGKNSRAYFEHSVANNKSLENTEALLRSRGLDRMADSIAEHRTRMAQIAKDWDNYSPEQREQVVANSYATMAVQLHSTKFGGDSELSPAIMKNLAEVNLYDQELAGGKEVYMPSHGSFPAADKLVRVGGGTKAERIDKISVKFGKNKRIYGMPAQSNTICLLHPDSYYHNLTGGRVGMPGYETGVKSDVILTSDGWERMMEESGYSEYIPPKQRKALLTQYQRLQKVIEEERGRLKKRNIRDIVLMMKDNPKIEQERRKLGELTQQVADTLEQHVGPESVSVLRNHPMSFASMMTTHATIRTAKGFPDLLHCHQELEMDKFSMGIDTGDDDLHHWNFLWRETDERGGGLLMGFSKE